ncbi:MAG: peptidylprolyl isomerase [Culicoidibacterales bacterium]
MRIKKMIKMVIIAMAMVLIVACGAAKTTNNGALPVVTMTMENGGIVEMELYPDIAPNTVANFASLIENKFYDGLIFHRVIPGFMVQGGDPLGTGTGGPGYSIPGEFSQNGKENTLLHEKGVLSMARSGAPDSAGSQFFIMVDEERSLNGSYAAFGKVILGMDVVDKIAAVQKDAANKPVEAQKIKTMVINLNGVKLPGLIKT